MLSFRTLLRVGTVHTLTGGWRPQRAPRIAAAQRFVRKLRQNLDALEGAVTERSIDGSVEAHINRLKTLRRQMYGRCGTASATGYALEGILARAA